MRTPFVRKEDVAGDKHPRNWWIVDAEGKTLGRVATQIARALRGKHKAVIIATNIDKIEAEGGLDDQVKAVVEAARTSSARAPRCQTCGAATCR